jgi:uncharacterized membrane protein YkoI
MNTKYRWLSVSLLLAFLCGRPLIAGQPPKNIISIEKATKTALKRFPGTVRSSELEQEEGKWIYSFRH